MARLKHALVAMRTLRRWLAGDPWTLRTFVFIAAMTALRLVVAASTPLSDTEAYYVGWARWPGLSYYDHPPLVAWTTWLASHAGNGAFAVKLVPVACAAVFDGLVFRLAARMFSRRAAFLAVLVLGVMPAFLGAGVLVNPEALLLPLWVAWITALWDLREGDEAFRPLLLGAIIGVGFLAKYTALLEVPLSLGFVATSRDTRRWLRRPSFYAGGLVALAVTMPVIVWNAARGFPSVRLHLVERASPASLAAYASRTVEMFVCQVILFHLLVFPALVIAAVVMLVRARRDGRYRLLAWASMPTLAFLFAMMVRVRDAEPHWTMVAFVPLGIALSALVDEAFEPRAVRAYVAVIASSSAIVLALYLTHVHSPVIVRALPPSIYDAQTDPVNETYGWRQIDAAIREQAEALGPSAVVASDHNVLCGHVEVALDDSPHVYCLSARRTEFDFVGRGSVPPDAPVVYVETARYARDPAVALPGRACALADPLEVRRGGRVVQHVRIWSCPAAGAPENFRQAMR